jgi:hypothetical protein
MPAIEAPANGTSDEYTIRVVTEPDQDVQFYWIEATPSK